MEWIRRLFCKHEWERLGGEINVLISYFGEIPKFPDYRKQTYICRKCLKKRCIKY